MWLLEKLNNTHGRSVLKGYVIIKVSLSMEKINERNPTIELYCMILFGST